VGQAASTLLFSATTFLLAGEGNCERVSRAYEFSKPFVEGAATKLKHFSKMEWWT